MICQEIVFDYVNLLHYKCHKINPNLYESYIDPPEWIKIKEETINPIKKIDNEYFQYDVIVALNYEEIKKIQKELQKLNLHK